MKRSKPKVSPKEPAIASRAPAAIVPLGSSMSVEELRNKTNAMVKDALAHTWLVTGENRRLLLALKAFLETDATDNDYARILAHLPPA